MLKRFRVETRSNFSCRLQMLRPWPARAFHGKSGPRCFAGVDPKSGTLLYEAPSCARTFAPFIAAAMASLSPDKRKALEARLKAENEKSKLQNKVKAPASAGAGLHACAAALRRRRRSCPVRARRARRLKRR
jgi:hypothetical protein